MDKVRINATFIPPDGELLPIRFTEEDIKKTENLITVFLNKFQIIPQTGQYFHDGNAETFVVNDVYYYTEPDLIDGGKVDVEIEFRLYGYD